MVTAIKPKSLRQLAKELGISHSYLSQVKHGKRPASEKLQASLNMVSKSEARLRTSNPLMGALRYPWWVRLPFAPARDTLLLGNINSFKSVTKRLPDNLVFCREDSTQVEKK